MHPGDGIAEVRDQTGFEFDRPENLPFTRAPDPAMPELVRSKIRDEIAETDPSLA